MLDKSCIVIIDLENESITKIATHTHPKDSAEHQPNSLPNIFIVHHIAKWELLLHGPTSSDNMKTC